jgi:hypothetical protein
MDFFFCFVYTAPMYRPCFFRKTLLADTIVLIEDLLESVQRSMFPLTHIFESVHPNAVLFLRDMRHLSVNKQRRSNPDTQTFNPRFP